MEVIVINNESMGKGSDELGRLLMGAFLKKHWARPDKPDIIIMYNSGVKLLMKKSGFMDVLVGLEESGVEILACGTCINYYEMSQEMIAGRISSMEEIVDILSKANKAITI